MFPLGIFPYLVGGILIGIGVSYVYITTGLHATQSSFFSTTISYFSQIPYFQQQAYRNSRSWRITFALGVIGGAFIYSLILSPDGFFITTVQWWRLLIGGFLVGFGHALDGIFRDADHGGQGHERQQQGAAEGVQARGQAEELFDQGRQHHQAEKSQHHGRNAGQQLDEGF